MSSFFSMKITDFSVFVFLSENVHFLRRLFGKPGSRRACIWHGLTRFRLDQNQAYPMGYRRSQGRAKGVARVAVKFKQTIDISQKTWYTVTEVIT